MGIDSAFARLTSAWGPAVKGARKHKAAVVHWAFAATSGWGSSLGPSTTPVTEGNADGAAVAEAPPLQQALVLIATRPSDLLQPMAQTVEARARGLALRIERLAPRLRCVPVTGHTPDELERQLQSLEPRLLLADLALVEAFGADCVRRIRRRTPATDWLLLWDEPSEDAFDLVVHAHMHGCLEWRADERLAVRALDAVAAGEVWFPRHLLRSMYLSLLAATQTQGTSSPMPLDPAPRGEDLTARELEVLALMRHGLTNRQIAERMGVSVNTVKKHLSHAFEKRGLHNRRQSIA